MMNKRARGTERTKDNAKVNRLQERANNNGRGLESGKVSKAKSDKDFKL